MKKLWFFLVGFILAGSLSATPNTPPDPRVERIVERLAGDSELFGLQAPTGIQQASLIDFAGVGAGLSGCPPANKARAFYDLGSGTFRVINSSCLDILNGGSSGGFPRLDQVTDPNFNRIFNAAGLSWGSTGGTFDISGSQFIMPTSGATACATSSANNQLCLDSTNNNIVVWFGAAGKMAVFPDANTFTDGDIVGVQIVGSQILLKDLGPPAGGGTGGTVVTAITTNIREGDTLCWDTTLATPNFVNCSPGVPINVQTGTTYTFDGVNDRGTAIISSNTNPQAYSMAAITDAGNFDSNWFAFQHNKNSGTVTVSTTAPSTFDDTGTQSTTLLEGQACTFLTDTTGNGTLYPKCHEPRMTASAPIAFTRSPYGLTISCPTCSVGAGNVTGSFTAGKVPVASALHTLIDGSILDDSTHAARNDFGYDVNQAGAYIWWSPNNAGTGTTVNKLACDDGAGKAIICPFASSTTNNPLGVAVAANGATPGNAGSTGICIIGFCSVIFDNGATAGHYAQSSTTVAGDLSDVGATIPTNGQSYWYIFTGNAGAGTAAIIRNLTPSELNASSISGGNGRNLQIQFNGTATTKSIKNFNSTTPAPGAGFLAATWASSSSGNTDSAIAKIAISGNTATVASAGTISGTAAACGDGSGNITNSGCPASTGGAMLLKNSSTVGTTINRLVAQDADGTARLTSLSSNLNTGIGICTGGCGTTGDATVTFQGDSIACDFDGATTTNDLVVSSTTTAGMCHDSGSATLGSSTILTTGVLMSVLTTNGGAGTYNVRIQGQVTGSGISAQSGGQNQIAMWNSAQGSGNSRVTGMSGAPFWYIFGSFGNQLIVPATRDANPDNFCTGCTLLVKNGASASGIGIKFTSAAGGVGQQWFLQGQDSTGAAEGYLGPNFEHIDNDFNTGFCGMGSHALGFSSVGTYARLQKINSTSAAADAAGVIYPGAFGVADRGCFTIVYSPFGRARIDTDNTETVGDYLIPSITTGGKAHSVGAVWPFAGQVIGQAYATNVGAANATKYIQNGAEVRGGAYGVYNNTQTAQVALIADTTMVTAPETATAYRFSGSLNCTTSSAAATATLNLKWTDTSNTAQTLSVTATCTTLGAASVADMVHQIRAKASTAVTYGVTIANTPTFDVDVRLEAMGPN